MGYREWLHDLTTHVTVDGVRLPVDSIYVPAISVLDKLPIVRPDLRRSFFVEGAAGIGKSLFVKRIIQYLLNPQIFGEENCLAAIDDVDQVVSMLVEAFEESIGFGFVSRQVREEDFMKAVVQWFDESKDLSKIGTHYASDFKKYWAKISNEQADEFAVKYQTKVRSSTTVREGFPSDWSGNPLPVLVEVRNWNTERFARQAQVIDIYKLLKDSQFDSQVFFQIVELSVRMYGEQFACAAAAVRYSLLGVEPKKRIVLVVDGVDELPSICTVEGRVIFPRFLLMTMLANVIPELEERGHRLIITGRPGDPNANEIFSAIQIFQLSELSDGWKKRYLHRFLASYDGDNYPANAMYVHYELQKVVRLQSNVRALSGIPLLLTGLAVLISEKKVSRSSTKLDLVEKWSERLLSKRFPKIAGGPQSNAKRIVIAIATEMQNRGVFAMTEEAILGVVKKDLQDETLDIVSQSGLFDFRNNNVSFLHRTFQSYFYALSYAEKLERCRDETQVSKILSEFLEKNLHPDFGFEALTFVFGKLLSADSQPYARAAVVGFVYERCLCAIGVPTSLSPWSNKAIDLANCLVDYGGDVASYEVKIRQLCEQSIQIGPFQNLQFANRDRAGTWLFAERCGHDFYRAYGQSLTDEPRFMWSTVIAAEHKLVISSYLTTIEKFADFYACETGYRNVRWFDFTAEDFDLSLLESWEVKRGKLVGKANCPVTHVSWFEAVAYCRWLNDRILSGDELNLPEQAVRFVRAGTHEVRLLTTEEWFSVARSDWVFRNCADLRGQAGWANTKESANDRPVPVGIYYSSSGIYDLVGNVREWGEPTLRVLDKNGQVMAPLFGGAWNTDLNEALQPLYLNRNDRNGKFGFRIACAPVEICKSQKS